MQMSSVQLNKIVSAQTRQGIVLSVIIYAVSNIKVVFLTTLVLLLDIKVCRHKHVYCSFLTHILPVFEPKPELNRSDGRLTFLGCNPVTKL